MPKLPDKKVRVYDLDKLSVDERAEALRPIIETNAEQFKKIAEAISGAASIANAFKNLPTIKLPDYSSLFANITLPEMPDMNIYPNIEPVAFERYDPPVTIKKSKWEIEKEEREAYMTELQIKILEQQLNIVKGMQTPQYDISTGIITFMGKQIEIPLNTNMEMICRIVLKNVANMKHKWSWDEIVEQNRESIERFTSRKIYTATRAINEKVALETSFKDFLIAKPLSTVQLNPRYLAK